MNSTCPANSVDSTTVRIVAGLVVAIAAASVVLDLPWLVWILAGDFIIRGFIDRKYSPLRLVAKRIQGLLKLEADFVYAPPKQFAARVGTVFTVAATVLYLAGQPLAAVMVTGALVVAASLEAVLGFCMACWVYPHLQNLMRRS